MTFSSPSWRSLKPLKGSLNHPKKVTKNCQVIVISSRHHLHPSTTSTWTYLSLQVHALTKMQQRCLTGQQSCHPSCKSQRNLTSNISPIMLFGRRFTTIPNINVLILWGWQLALVNVQFRSGYPLMSFLAGPPSFLVVIILVMIPLHHFWHEFFETARNQKIEGT